MNTKFKDTEAVYLRNQSYNDFALLAKQAVSFDELKTVCTHIIKSGMYKRHKPKGRTMKKHLHEYKLNLLITLAHRLRAKMKTEEQCIELCELSIKNVFWRGYCWNNHGKDPNPRDIYALRDLAYSFKGFHMLYLYDIGRRDQHLESLKRLASTTEHQKILEQLSA